MQISIRGNSSKLFLNPLPKNCSQRSRKNKPQPSRKFSLPNFLRFGLGLGLVFVAMAFWAAKNYCVVGKPPLVPSSQTVVGEIDLRDQEQLHLQSAIIGISHEFPSSSPFALQNLPNWILSKTKWTRAQCDQAASFLWSETVALNVQNGCHGDPRPNQIILAGMTGRN